MVTSIVTLLAIGIAAGVGTHRNRFRPVRRARQQPPGAEGPSSPTGPVNRKSGPDTGLPIAVLASPARTREHSIAGNAKAHHRQRSKEHANN
jgi:hypothetical protein